MHAGLRLVVVYAMGCRMRPFERESAFDRSTRLPVRSLVRIDYRWKFSATVSNLLTGDLAGRWIKPGTDDDERTCRCLENLLRGRKERSDPTSFDNRASYKTIISQVDTLYVSTTCSTRHKLSGKRLGIPDRGEKQVTH